MPLTNPPVAPSFAGPLGFYGATPISQPGPYTALYTPTNRALGAYTPNTQTGAYTGGLLDLLQAAKLTDLNILRVAVENLRTMSEACAQQHNALVADLKALGLVG